ncbi:MAG: FAD-dependent oxidoreductase [Spongiibacteraceae bacterium]
MKFDVEVAVIGGGIQGAGVAQAASAAGFSTLIFDKNNWGSGTSSKSSKLIHGGLRYLESGQISLVKESLNERRILLNIAATLVKPLELLIPVYQQTKRRPWQLYIGLSLYSLLAGIIPLSRFKSYAADDIDSAMPLLRTQLQRVFSYWDAQTHDQHLTEAVIASANKLGATTLANTQCISVKKVDQGYTLQIKKTTDGATSEGIVHCRYLVNASGPWVNEVAANIFPAPSQLAIDWVKGSHLILRGQISDKGFYLEAPSDQRAVFVLPWHGDTLIGTTEQAFTGNPDQVDVSTSEIDYLLATLHHYFPSLEPDIIGQFAGLRVLPKGNSSLFSRPRDCILHSDPNHPKLLSLYGGKLTGYRHNAEQVIKHITRQLGPRRAIANTATLKLDDPSKPQ